MNEDDDGHKKEKKSKEREHRPTGKNPNEKKFNCATDAFEGESTLPCHR